MMNTLRSLLSNIGICSVTLYTAYQPGRPETSSERCENLRIPIIIIIIFASNIMQASRSKNVTVFCGN